MRPCKVSKSPQWLTKISRASCATIGDADLKLIDLRASVRRPDNCLCCDFDHQARNSISTAGFNLELRVGLDSVWTSCLAQP
jgi:hypothetical protein